MHKKLWIALLACFLLVGCASGESDTSVDESVAVADTAVPPTDTPPKPTPLPPTTTPAPDPVELVLDYNSALNAKDEASLLKMLSTDTTFTETGQEVLSGLEAVTAKLRYEMGLNCQITLHDCAADETAVNCQGEMINDWQTAVALPPFQFDAIAFTLTDGLIASQDWEMAADSEQAVQQTLSAFRNWTQLKRPSASRELFTAEGQLVPTAENSAMLIEIMTEWATAPLVTTEEGLTGIWDVEAHDQHSFMQFANDGTGLAALTREALNHPDLESGQAIALNYWFADDVLHLQYVDGYWIGWTACDAEQVGRYLLEGASGEEIKFLRIEDPCEGRKNGFTYAPIWDWYSD